MAIPHQVHLTAPLSGGLGMPPDPKSSVIETFPLDEATIDLATSADAWQGVAQIFDLQVRNDVELGSTFFVNFVTTSPSVIGLKYRFGLYKETATNEATCLAKSPLLYTNGGYYGACCVRLTADQNVSISTAYKYFIAFTMGGFNTGSITLKAKPEDYVLQAQHITYPSNFNAESADSAWNTIRYGSWNSDYDVWFGLALDNGETEVLP